MGSACVVGCGIFQNFRRDDIDTLGILGGVNEMIMPSFLVQRHDEGNRW
jgi:hypothetical protein